MDDSGHENQFYHGFPLEGITDIEVLKKFLQEVNSRLAALEVGAVIHEFEVSGVPVVELSGPDLDRHIEELVEQTNDDVRIAAIRSGRREELYELKKALLKQIGDLS